MFAAHNALMTGTKAPVTMTYSATSSAMPAHSAGDMLAAVVQGYSGVPATPPGWSVLQNGTGGGNTIWLKTVYKVATSSSETWPINADSCFAFKNATRISGYYWVPYAQYPNGARPYVQGQAMLDPSGNSYVLGFGNYSSGFWINGYGGTAATSSYSYLYMVGQSMYFYLTNTRVSAIPTEYIAPATPSYMATQNFNTVVFEVAN